MEAAQKTTLGLSGPSIREKFLFLNSGMQMGIKTHEDLKHATRALAIDTIWLTFAGERPTMAIRNESPCI